MSRHPDDNPYKAPLEAGGPPKLERSRDIAVKLDGVEAANFLGAQRSASHPIPKTWAYVGIVLPVIVDNTVYRSTISSVEPYPEDPTQLLCHFTRDDRYAGEVLENSEDWDRYLTLFDSRFP